MEQREYYSLRRAAEEFGVSERTLYRLRQEGKLMFYKLGGRTLVRRAEIKALIIEAPAVVPNEKIQKSFS